MNGRLIWALRHPDGDRALLAARTLGTPRAREAIPALREAVTAGPDIYLRTAALQSLIAIAGVDPLRSWLEELSRAAPVTVREAAGRALAGNTRNAGRAAGGGDGAGLSRPRGAM